MACGYSQIPGVDFGETHSPVTNELTVRMIIVIMLVWNLDCCLVDVETAFLHGILSDDEAVYMDCPDGMEHEPDECLQLVKMIYGLKQSARAFFEAYKRVMEEAGFVILEVDPCLFIKNGPEGVVFAITWVDDCLFIGNKTAISEAIGCLQKKFKLKINWEVNDYLSCEFVFDKKNGSAWIGQLHMYKKLEKTFEGLLPNRKFKVPSDPRFQVIKPEEEEQISQVEQSLYRSGVGQLLFLIKFTRPDLANAVRELSKGVQAAGADALKELKRVVKFALDTRDMGLCTNRQDF